MQKPIAQRWLNTCTTRRLLHNNSFLLTGFSLTRYTTTWSEKTLQPAKAPGLLLPVKNFSSCVLCFIHFLSSSDYKTLFKTLRRILVLINHFSASQLSLLCDRSISGMRYPTKGTASKSILFLNFLNFEMTSEWKGSFSCLSLFCSSQKRSVVYIDIYW